MPEVMPIEQFDIVIKENNACYYSNFGIDYPLNDIEAQTKLYKDVKWTELRPINY